MKKSRPLPFLLILAAILLVMSLPRAFSEKGRGAIAAIFSPLWGKAGEVKAGIDNIWGGKAETSEKIQHLRTENQSLRRELKHVQEIIQHELYLTRSGVQRSTAWQKLLDSYAEALPGRVIFRNSSSWNSSCWINVGSEENQRIGKEIISKNSPVVLGYSLVGVVDYVGKSQSRVRLLTDSGLTPSVRVVRGEPKQRMLAEQLNLMMDALMEQDAIFEQPGQKMALIDTLEDLEKKLQVSQPSLYLAKGVLSGSSHPSWRSQGSLLKGTGFNCDFADALSPERDLRTGAVTSPSKQSAVSIVKEKDLLITTGMDGIFPAGLHVAKVVKVLPLKEGDYYYELEALPVAGNLDDLSLVYVLPPVGYDPEVRPPLMGWE